MTQTINKDAVLELVEKEIAISDEAMDFGFKVGMHDKARACSYAADTLRLLKKQIEAL